MREIDCEIGGRGFLIGGMISDYYVWTDGLHKVCEYKGYLRHGDCKHIQMVKELIRGGA